MPFKDTNSPYVKAKKAEYARRYRERHPEKFNQPLTEAQKEYHRKAVTRHREKHREKVLARSRELQEQKRRKNGIQPRKPKMTKEQVRARARELYRLNPEKMLEKARRCNAKRKDYAKQFNKQYREKNKAVLRATRSLLRQQWTPEQRAASNAKDREYYHGNPEQSKVRQAAKAAVRRTRKRGGEGTVTAKEIAGLFQRQRGKCATCKCKITKTGPRAFHVDHVNPLVNGGSNTIENVALLCEPCNLRKGTSDPHEWANRHGLLFF